MKQHMRTIEVPPLDFRAEVGAVDDASRIVNLTFSTGADVVRYDYMEGFRYVERLSMKPKAVRLDRMNSGAPLLNAHSSYTLADQFGVVVDGSAAVSGGRGRAQVKFSKRADVEPFFQDVKDRIIRNVSVGYRVHTFEQSDEEVNGLPVRTAIDWEPFEISLVPMPADVGAQIRSAETAAKLQMNLCVIVTRGIDLPRNEDADRLRRLRLAQLHR